MTVVGDDAAPRAERTIVLWNPPLLDAELGLRGSALAEAAKLQAMFVERGLRTLTFAKSRKAAELIHRFTAERLGDDTTSRRTAPATPRSSGARSSGGWPAGELLGVSATNALELGIDVGLLDAVISVGFPAPSRRCASSGAARGAAAAGSRCSSRARTGSTSSSCASPTSCSGAASRRRSSTTRTHACSPGTCAPPRTRRR